VIGHLGPRVSALLDGQLPAEEAERAWAHVHACHACRDAVEREGWVKTRLAGLSADVDRAPDHLKGSLLCPSPFATGVPDAHRSRHVGMIALGGSAAGVAVLGVLALGLTSNTPAPERGTPVTNFGGTDAPRQLPARIPGSILERSRTTPSR
jgi:anti-sigma factor RsiW